MLTVLSAMTASCAESTLSSLQEQTPSSGAIRAVVGPLISPVQGLDVEHVFEIRNPLSDKAVKYTQLRRSCGCVSAEPHDFTIPPGGVSRITFKTHLPRQNGTRLLSATYEPDDAALGEVRLELTARTLKALSVTPEYAPIPLVKPGDSAQFEFEVTTVRDGSAQENLVDLQLTPSDISYEHLSSTESSDGPFKSTKRRFRVTVPGTLTSGEDRNAPGLVTFRQGGESCQRVLRWRKIRPFSTIPSQVYLKTSGKTAAEAKIEVRLTELNQILDASCEPAFLHVVSLNRSAREDTFTIVVRADPIRLPSGSSIGKLNVTSNQPGRAKYSIPIFLLH